MLQTANNINFVLSTVSWSILYQTHGSWQLVLDPQTGDIKRPVQRRSYDYARKCFLSKKGAKTNDLYGFMRIAE